MIGCPYSGHGMLCSDNIPKSGSSTWTSLRKFYSTNHLLLQYDGFILIDQICTRSAKNPQAFWTNLCSLRGRNEPQLSSCSRLASPCTRTPAFYDLLA